MEETKYIFTKKRTCALLTVIIMILNMFSPYSILIKQVQAAEPAAGEPYFKLTLPTIDTSGPSDEWSDETWEYYYEYDGESDISSYDGPRIVKLKLSLHGNSCSNGGDILLKYPGDKIKPAQVTATKKGNKYTYTLEEATLFTNPGMAGSTSFGEANYDITPNLTLDTGDQTIRVQGSMNGKTRIEDGAVVATFMFMMADGVDISDITTSDFELKGATGLNEGLQITYYPHSGAQANVQEHVDGIDYLKFDGFAQGAPKVDSIVLKTPPTKDKYYNTENLDFTGGVITVNYDVGDPKDIVIKDEIAAGTLKVNSTTANETTKKVTFTYEGKTVDFEYYTLDSIAKKTDLNKMDYEHNDNVVFTGGKLEAAYSKLDGTTATQELDIVTELGNGNLTVNNTNTAKADVDNKTLTFNYHTKTTTMELNVTDPIDSISITKQPNQKTFNDTETIDLTGAEITPHTRSGKALTPIALPNANVSGAPLTASINAIPVADRWEVKDESGNPTGLTAGKQTVTLTYEGKTADLEITVNDVVKSVTITKQPTAKNKYGIAASQLDFTGLEATVTTNGGGSFKIGANSLSIDTSTFTSNTLNTQNFTATYGTITASNNVEIKLTNYITGITVNFPDTEFDYGTTLQTALANATYTKVYADTSGNTTQSITSGMVTGYNGSPAASLFNSSHEYSENLTIKLTTTDNPFDILPAVANQTIKIKDIIDEANAITIKYKPSLMTYKYGETFKTNGGMITLHYKSGNTTDISMGNSDVSVTETSGAAIDMSPDVSKFTNGQMTKTLKVTYTKDGKSYSTSLSPLTIVDVLDRIEKIKDPKTEYKHGEAFDTADGTFKAVYKSGKEETVSLASATFTENGSSIDMTPLDTEYGEDNTLTKTVTASYTVGDITKKLNYDITLKNYVTGISMHTTPKDAYNVNENFEITGGEIAVERAAGGAADIIAIDAQGVNIDSSAFNKTAEGTYTINVSYTEGDVTEDTSYNVTVTDTITSVVKGKDPTKTEYKYGETLDLTGGTILVQKGSGTKTIQMTDTSKVTLKTYDPEYIGTQTVEVECEGETISFDITIKDYVKEIIVNPSTVRGIVNDTLSDLITDNSITYTVVYAKAGAKTPETLEESMVSGYSETSKEEQNLKVKYIDNDTNSASNGETIQGDLKITLSNLVKSITITAPDKTEYKHGENLNLAGGTITVEFEDRTTVTRTMTTDMIKEADGKIVNMSPTATEYTNNRLTKTLKIKYEEDGKTGTADYEITLINYVTGISMHTTPKDAYNVNENFETTGGEIAVERAAGGTPEIIAIDAQGVNVDSSAFNKTAEGTYTINVSYTEGDVTEDTSYNVTVTDTITSVVKGKDPTKTEYKYGETLDLTGGTILVTKGSGTTTINMTDTSKVTLKTYDPEHIGEQTVEVECEGETISFDITIKDYVKEIIVNPSTVRGIVNDTLSDLITDNSITYTVVYAKAGVQTPETLEKSMVSGYSETSKEEQNLKVKYIDNDANSASNGETIQGDLKITLSNLVKSITITAPDKTEYKHGENLNLAGGTITVEFEDRTTVTRTMTTDMIKEADGKIVNMSPTATEYTNNRLTKTLKIKYEEGEETGVADYEITLINYVTGISMHTTPKDAYNVNENFETTGGEIAVERAAGGTPEIIAIDAQGVNVDSSKFDNSKEGTYTIDVSYTEGDVTEDTSYNVTVTDTIISVTKGKDPTKTEYKYGETLDLTGGTILVTKGSGTTTINMTDTSKVTLKTYDPEHIGTQTIEVECEGETISFDITIKDYVKEIKVNPSTVTGITGDTLSDLITDNSITYTVVYAKAGAQTPKTLVDSMIAGYDSTSKSEQNLKVKYIDTDTNSASNGETIQGNLTITLSNPVKSITITAPDKTEYNHGAALNLTGGTITVEFEDRTTVTRTMTKDMIKEADGTQVNMSPTKAEYTNNKLEKTLKIEYSEGGKTEAVNYPITITNNITGISMHKTPKDAYNVNESFETTGGEIKITRAVNGDTPEVISINAQGVNVDSSKFDNSKDGTYTINVSYTEGKDTKTTSYPVTVKDKVISVTKGKNPDKTEYKYGETLDLTGGTIAVVKGSGTETIKMTDPKVAVKTYDKEHIGTQTVEVVCEGTTIRFDIVIKDYVKEIKVNPNTVTGEANDTLSEIIADNSIKYQVVYAKAGAQTPKALVDSMVTGYNSTSLSEQDLKVQYLDNDINSASYGQTIKANLKITLSNPVRDIKVTKLPSKVTYNHGEGLVVTDGEITVTYETGAPKVIAIKPNMVTEIDGKSVNMSPSKTEYTNDKVTKTLTIKYKEGKKSVTENYTITINDFIKGIVVKEPNKVKYEYGESLNLTGATVQEIMASGNAKTPNALTSDMITNTFDSTKEGAQTINVLYKGFKDSFVVTVQDNIQSISIDKTPKTQYKYGESLDVTGGTIIATKSSGKTTTINLTPSMVKGFNPNKLGEQELTVEYKGKKATYKVNVNDFIKDIQINKPKKNVYKIGEEIDLAGGTISKVMASGTSTTPVDMTDKAVTIKGFDTSSEGAKVIKVTYGGFTKTFGITVVDPVKEIKLKDLPKKTDYLYGDTLDVKGGTIEITKESGKSQIIDLSISMVTGYNPKKLGNQTLTVTYKGTKVGEFIVNVQDKVVGLKVKEPDKTEYEYGESLELEGGKVSIMMASGNIQETSDMTASMVNGYEKKKVGKQTIKVEYKGLTGSFQVSVIDEVKGITMETEPEKIEYEPGEDINLKDGTIKVIKSSGEEIVPITKSMISGYDPNKSGTQFVTVTYEGFTTKFIVLVREEKKEEPVKPEPSKPVVVITQTKPAEPEVPETPVVEEPVKTPDTTQNNQNQEKPTEVLGVKDEQNDLDRSKLIAGGITLAGILFLLLLFLFRRNVKIYIEVDGEFELGGLDKITKKNRTIDVDRCLDGETYQNKVKVRLSDSISEKLDGKEVEIKHRGKTVQYKVTYKDEPFEIILE